MPIPSAPLLDKQGFTDLAHRVRNRPARPRQAQQGAAAAHALVQLGLTVSLGEGPAEPALPSSRAAAEGVPQPYRLTDWVERGDDWEAVNHRFEVDVHGATSMTHIDAVDHFRWDGAPALAPEVGTLDRLSEGLLSRGVLLDVPGVTGAPVPPGHVITLAEVCEALDRQQTELRPGDALYINLGRAGARCSHVELGSEPVAGLSIECAEWLAEAAPSVVITDAGLDPTPSQVTDLPVPWHLLLLTVLGIPLVDMAKLGPLAATCRRLGRWEFLSVMAPLPLRGASGSPVNPLAVF